MTPRLEVSKPDCYSLSVLLQGSWIAPPSGSPALAFCRLLSPLISPLGTSASQVRLGPRTNTGWSIPTTSAWSWRRSSITAVTSPSGGNQSWPPTWGSLNGRCVGPLLQPQEQSGLQATRQIMELSQGRTERLSPGHVASTTETAAAMNPLANKTQYPSAPIRG